MALIGSSENKFIYTPAYNNIYTVVFGDGDTNPAEFSAVDVSFGDESLSFIRNPATTYFNLKEGSYKRSDTLSITWRESDGYPIKQLHMDWIGLFYDTATDTYKSAFNKDEAARRYKKICVKVRSSNDPKSFKQFTFTCLPSNIGNLHLAWGVSPGVVTYTINYYVDDWDVKDVRL